MNILITKNLKDLSIEKIAVGGRKVHVASLKELLKMKLEAGRPQDLIDAENIKIKLKR